MTQLTATWRFIPVDKSDPTTWESVPKDKQTLHVDKKYIRKPIVLENAVRSSDVFTNQNRELNFEDLERDFVVDQSVKRKKIEITARCIVILPGVDVRAKKIFLRAHDGYYNLGRMNYKHMESWSPRSYSDVEGSFVQGQGSQAVHHLWPESELGR